MCWRGSCRCQESPRQWRLPLLSTGRPRPSNPSPPANVPTSPSSLVEENNENAITGPFSFSLRRSLSLEDWSRVTLGRSPMRSGVTLSLRFASASGAPGCCGGSLSEAAGAGPSGLQGGSRPLCPVSPRASSSLGLPTVTVSLALRWVPASPLSPGGCFMLPWCQRRFWL